MATSPHRLVLEPLEPRLVLDGGPLLISEFMALNNSMFADDDGDYSDWLEIKNAGDAPVELGGWYLTDDASDLTQWEFPQVTLGGGDYLVVFASGKDRTDPGGELHTNFKLRGGGEYLALVHSDGKTVADAFDPGFPEQVADVSYGLVSHVTTLIPQRHLLTYHVPTSADAALATDWTATDFDDSTWDGFTLTPPVLITEVGTGTTDWLEIQNLDKDAVDTDGWVVGVNNGSEGINVPHDVFWSLPGAMAPGETLYRTDKTDNNYFGVNISWKTAGNGWVMVLDDYGNVADFVAWGYDEAELASLSVNINGFDVTPIDIWNGPPPSRNTGRDTTLQRTGGMDHDNASDFAWTEPDSPGEQNAALAVPFPSGKPFGVGFDTSQTAFGGAIQTDVQGAMHGVNASLWTRSRFEVGDLSLLDTMKLRIQYDDGFVAYVNGQEVARRNAPDSVAWDSSAMADRPRQQAIVVEQIDVTEHVSLLHEGINVLAIQGLNNGADDGEFLISPELVGKSDKDVLRYMDGPTPGAANQMTTAGGTPQFSHPSGTFTEPFSLELSSDFPSPSAVIRYTLDGSETTGESAEYVGPITINTSTKVRARVFEPDLLPGPLASASYIVLAADVQDFTSDLPVIIVENFGGRRASGGQTMADYHFSVFEPQEGTGRSALAEAPDANLRAGMRIRGSSSSGFPKHQYRVEVRGEDGNDLPVSLLGMPANSDWVLYGPYTDKSLIRNPFSYGLANDIGLSGMRTRYCEVFLNENGGDLQASDYVGIYVLIESIKRGPDRVDIPKLSPSDTTEPDVSGGYIVRFEAGVAQGAAKLSGWNNLELYQHDQYTAQQKDWISDHINEFDAVLKGPSFKDPEIGYAKYIDVESFVNIIVLNELVREQDSYSRSSYMWKDRGGKLTRGPLWDYNLSLGVGGYHNNLSRSGWQFAVSNTQNERRWNRRLFEDSDFRQKFIDRWHEVRQNQFDLDNLLARVDSLADPLREAEGRNFERWDILNRSIPFTTPMTQTWEEQIEYIRQWLIDRIAWIDGQFLAVPELSHPGGQFGAPLDLAMIAPEGTIYYTLDGTDPRLPGGAINPTATAYVDGSPATIDGSTGVFARVYVSGDFTAPNTNWSAPTTAGYYVHAAAGSQNVEVAELNYNPYEPTAEELAVDAGFTADDFEFIELLNAGDEVIDLGEMRLAEGVTLGFAVTTLQPGERGVVVNDRAAFQARYGTEILDLGVLVLGEYDGRLDNAGETITLADRFAQTILDFGYGDSGAWPGRADGRGASLELIDPAGVPADEPGRAEYLQDGDHWRSSTEYGGSPGDAGVGPITDVVINEVLSRTVAPRLDSIELHNTTEGPIDLGGWYLSDAWGWDSAEVPNYRMYRIEDGTTIDAGGYLVFDETHFNPNGALVGGGGQPGENEFELSGIHGDDVWLMRGDADGRLTHFVDHVQFGTAVQGESFGRWPDATGDLVPMAGLTLGETNAGPRVGPVIFSEVMYHPAGDETQPDSALLEFAEIHNPTAQVVDLTDWRIRRGIDFDFADGTLLDPHGTLVVLSFDPDAPANAAKLTEFRDYYGLDGSVRLVGGYAGRLANGGEAVQLQRPDYPPADEPDFVPHVIEDEVDYDDRSPWPIVPDGGGHSLNRVQSDRWGFDAGSWKSRWPTPGKVDLAQAAAAVTGRYVFYNNSAFDDPGRSLGDDDAIAPDKQALRPGQQATFDNYTSYARGINGVMIDVVGLPATASLDASDDFRFLVGNDEDPSGWSEAPAPQSLTVRRGAGVDGADRVTIVWADNAVAQQWLQVTVRATEHTGLMQDDVFYFGNAVGEAGNSTLNAIVNATDEIVARNFRHGPANLAAIDDPYDYNRDRLVDATDRAIARTNATGPVDALRLIQAPAHDAALQQVVESAADALDWPE